MNAINAMNEFDATYHANPIMIPIFILATVGMVYLLTKALPWLFDFFWSILFEDVVGKLVGRAVWGCAYLQWRLLNMRVPNWGDNYVRGMGRTALDNTEQSLFNRLNQWRHPLDCLHSRVKDLETKLKKLEDSRATTD